MIEITEPAVAKITDIMSEENNPALKLRVFVQGGGCSGFSYGFTLDEEVAEDDLVVEDYPNIKVIVDAMSLQYLGGSKIDYKEDLRGANFSISNPNATSTCGCGSSFSV
jgi:iron-sulfur cluster insertion protein